MRRLFSAASAALLALVLVSALPAAGAIAAPAHPAVGPLPGDTSDFTFASFDAVYRLSRDDDEHAKLTTTETIVAQFPQIDQNRGIVRAIPQYYGDVDVDPQVVSVTDQNGTPVHYEASRDGDFYDLALGTDAYVHGATTYVITYTQRDTIRAFSDTDSDEFYWDVNGTGWAQPFAEVSARLEVPADLAPSLSGHQACYQGAANAMDACDGGIQQSAGDGGATVFTASAHGLAAHENLTIAVGFASGTFVEGTPSRADASPSEPSWWQLLLGLGGIGSIIPGIVALRLGRSRTPKPGPIIVPQYAPPPSLGILPASRLLDRPGQARPAELIDLAVRGRIRLLGYPTQTHQSDADYAVQLLDRSGLDAFETQYLDALFAPEVEPGASRDLRRDGDAALGGALVASAVAANDWVDATFFGRRGSSTATKAWLVVTIVLCAGGIAGTVVGGVAGAVFGFLGFVPGLIALILAIVGAVGGKQLTPAAHGIVDHLYGMRMYMELAEADRMRVLQSATGAERVDTSDGRQIVKLHERLLPWAVLWGIEASWTAQLQTELAAVQQTPDWYVGDQAFTLAAFSPILSGMTRGLAAPVQSSSWSGSNFSSFSGGSFGGGFSGGGGGGGGGGGR